MGHIHIYQKRNKKNHKIIQGHPNKNTIQNAKHNTKHSETTPVKRETHRKWYLPYEMLRLSTQTFRTDREFCTRYKEHIQAALSLH
jgi:hypothetical protein